MMLVQIVVEYFEIVMEYYQKVWGSSGYSSMCDSEWAKEVKKLVSVSEG